MGSPPPTTLKKDVPKFLSVRSIVIPPANTGIDRRSRKAVTRIDHTYRFMSRSLKFLLRVINIVTIKFIAPSIDDIPAKCSEKITKSTAMPGCAIMLDSGGYKVQPVPAPPSIVFDNSKRPKAGGNSQKLTLLSRGKAMSGAPTAIGIIQFP